MLDVEADSVYYAAVAKYDLECIFNVDEAGLF